MSSTRSCGRPRFRDPLPGGALAVMRGALPAPYDRGMERMTVVLDRAQGSEKVPVPTFDFDGYERFYGTRPPSPRYLLAPRQDILRPLAVQVSYTRSEEPAEEPVVVRFPAGHPAGRAMTVPIPGNADVTGRLELVELAPFAPDRSFGTVTWEVTALLGNLAKLLWTIGAEHELVAEHLRDVTAQRHTETAHGVSLDLLGLDLGAPRFPPRPHTVDDATIALFHLDDVPPVGPDGIPDPDAEVPTVVDSAAPPTPAGPGRPGRNTGARSGRTGRFGHAFGFGPDKSLVTVDDAPAFALPATASLTVEAVVRTDRTTTTGAVVAKRRKLNTRADAGWALTVGTFRGIDRNVRFSLSDGTTAVEVFADRDLGDGAFHHIAGALSRADGTATVLLHVDGKEVARKLLDAPLGALTSPAELVIGRGTEAGGDGDITAQYTGLIEEVRVSGTARDTFAPVTGESDEQYRRRLRIFHSWLLPTPDRLQAAVNTVAGAIAAAPTDPEPFVVREGGGTVATGGLPLRVLPATLPVGQSLTAEGEFGTPEEATVGTAARDEPDFDPAWLISCPDRPGLTFEDDGDGRRIQLVVLNALDDLLGRLADQDRPADGDPADPAAPALHVLKAYDPTATGLHGVGRAVLLTHTPDISPARLGALAHAAGFAWVRHTKEGHIYASQPRGEVFRITTPATDASPGPPDVTVGGALELGVEPDPSRLTDAEIRWSILRSGAGDAAFRPRAPGTLHALAAGDVHVRVEVVRHGHVAGGTRRIRIGPSDTFLTAGRSISGTGRLDAGEDAAAGPPTDDFDPGMLRVRTDDLGPAPRLVDYRDEPGNRLMQRVTGDALDRLLALLKDTAGTLEVHRSYLPEDEGEPPPDDADDALHTQGRALRLRHTTLTAPALAARAFAAGFDHIRVDPAPPTDPDGPETVRVAVAAGEQLAVTRPNAAGAGEQPAPGAVVEPVEVEAGKSVLVEAAPAADPAAACFAPDGAQVFLAEPGTHRITSFTLEPAAGRPAPEMRLGTSHRVDLFPGALAFGGGHLFVAHAPRDRVAVLNPADLTPATTPPEIPCPRPTALAADADRLYVGCGDKTLRAFTLTTGQAAGTLSLPAAPRSLVVAAGSPSLFAVLDDGHWCRVERATLTLREKADTHDTGARAAAVTADGKKLYVICPGADPDRDGTVRVYRPPDADPTAEIGGLPAGAAPAALSLSGDGKLLFVATEGAAQAVGRVHVVDVATDVRLPLVFSPGRGGTALAASPAGTPYPPCLVMAPRHGGTVLLAGLAPLRADPPGPPRLDAELPLGTGAGEVLAWSVVPYGHGTAEPVTPHAPVCGVLGRTPGRGMIRAAYLPGEGLRPYQCELRLKTELESNPDAAVTKEQYDLILNVLNWFHPLGVECRTDRLRALADLDPEGAERPRLYTFPTYHVADPFSSPFIHLRKDDRHD
ncbi:LamG-like jellyroll fold domain-containing protein [Streptomyces venezuelae]|uniref:LamG-like jellyroll fold domain-containing protein n=1 Tax=Streptomyces venezuelae TaxID=54571 RepID=UPI00278C1509|nr:LamG-like jellyroll fold domain-containing protein [Streptomyces venezuelae]